MCIYCKFYSNRFSKFFHWHNQQYIVTWISSIFAIVIIFNPTTPQKLCYTTVWNFSVSSKKNCTFTAKCTIAILKIVNIWRSSEAWWLFYRPFGRFWYGSSNKWPNGIIIPRNRINYRQSDHSHSITSFSSSSKKYADHSKQHKRVSSISCTLLIQSTATMSWLSKFRLCQVI